MLTEAKTELEQALLEVEAADAKLKLLKEQERALPQLIFEATRTFTLALQRYGKLKP